MINQVAIRKVLILSTAHVSPNTRDWLNDQSRIVTQLLQDPMGERPKLCLYVHVYGWMFHVPDNDDPDVPSEIKTICAVARENGAEWVELDSDGDVLPDLQTWEW